MRRRIVAAGATLTVGEILEVVDGLDPRTPVYVPGWGRPRPLLRADVRDLEVVLMPSPAVLDRDHALAIVGDRLGFGLDADEPIIPGQST